MSEIFDALSHPLVSPIVIALLLGGIAYVLSRGSTFVCKLLAIAGSVLVLMGGVAILRYHTDKSIDWAWVELTSDITLSVQLAPTILGMIVMIGAAAFALLITVYSIRSMKGNYWEGKFYAYLLWTLAGASIVALANNLLLLLVGWEIVTLMLFLMINQGRADAKTGAAKTYGVLGFSDACLLLAIVLLAVKGGSAQWSLSGGAISVASLGATGYFVYVLIMIAALAKAGAIPLHTWVPAAAEGAPTSVMAYLPAALDKLLGIYLLAVLALRMFKPDWTMQVVMMVIGGVTILAAVVMAMVQHNLKKLLSFHAVSQVGYMVLGIGTGTTIGVIGGLFHMINNAIYKSNLFLMSGTIARATGSDEIEDMGGLGRHLPVTFFCGTVAALAISGIPPLNGFVSKWLVYQGTLEVSSVNRGLAVALVTVAVFGSALTLASFVKVLYSAFLSPVPKHALHATKKPRESFFLAAPMVILALACIVLGLRPSLMTERVLKPALVGTALTGQDITVTTAGVQTGQIGLWSPDVAMTLILIGILIGAVLVWVAMIGKKTRVVRPFLAGEVPAPGDDRFRVPGTHFYETISKLPGVGPLLAQGQRGALDLYHWTGKYGGTVVEGLRARHTGLISLYVAWVLMGLGAILVYLLLSAGV